MEAFTTLIVEMKSLFGNLVPILRELQVCLIANTDHIKQKLLVLKERYSEWYMTLKRIQMDTAE